MRIGLCYLHETKKGILVQRDLEMNNLNQQYDLCLLDFENWEDFLDYCEFQDYTSFVFIANGERIIEIAKLLNTTYNEQIFSVYDKDLVLRYGEMLNLESNLKVEQIDNSYDEESYLRAGSYSFITGIYETNIPNNVLKHIYLKDSKLINKITLEFFLKSSINTAIVTSDISGESTVYPFIYLNESYLDLNKYESIDKESLKDNILLFINKGIINSYKAEGILDFGSLLGLDRNNRIFLSNEGVFSDFKMSERLLDLDSLNLNNLKNRQSINRESEFTLSEATTFNLIATLGSYMNLGQLNVITPYNFGFLPPTKVQNNKYIGFFNENNYFLYDLTSRKLFRVDNNFLVILEFYIKNQLDSKLLDDLNFSKETINQFILTLENYTRERVLR
ncbi:hypothetical protein [Niallia sp. BSM11]|uniref:hypothetical protein n=1 Tax=Niallia sp. BSM11 TaxID=3391576 RepID=UPI0039847F0E